MTAPATQRIRELNDLARQTFSDCRVLVTRGGQALDATREILAHVRQYSSFTQSNDPYGEHDFGSIQYQGETIFWKIDCYDSDLVMASPDPADPTVTVRVLTIMLGSEY